MIISLFNLISAFLMSCTPLRWTFMSHIRFARWSQWPHLILATTPQYLRLWAARLAGVTNDFLHIGHIFSVVLRRILGDLNCLKSLLDILLTNPLFHPQLNGWFNSPVRSIQDTETELNEIRFIFHSVKFLKLNKI